MNSLKSGPYYPVSSTFNILKPLHSVLISKKLIKHSNQNKVRREPGLSPIPIFPWLFFLLWLQILENMNSLITKFHILFKSFISLFVGFSSYFCPQIKNIKLLFMESDLFCIHESFKSEKTHLCFSKLFNTHLCLLNNLIP